MPASEAASMEEGSSATRIGTSTISRGGDELANIITPEDIDRKPWKYVGYRNYARFVASEDDFFILRRFGSLSVRIALFLQDEIAVLENELDEIDKMNSRKDSADVHNGSFRQDNQIQHDRITILHKIRQRILKYKMKKLQTPRRQDIRSLRNWHHNHDHAAISPEEQEYLGHENDLFSVVQKDKTPLRKFIDNSRRLRTLSIWRLKNQDSPDHERGVVSYYSDKRINTFASGVVVSLGIILLLAPLWILYALQSSALKLAVITVFITTFLIILSFAMVAKPFEVLGATAAYAAVLMVFLQFGGDSS
ncbi:hypothetical protein GGR51DRAFT_552845 [Nemania sp. FL0031]|nr:hypothetical protein GGR51DRAFT_552845 [Nemania sp. FL0031]